MCLSSVPFLLASLAVTQIILKQLCSYHKVFGFLVFSITIQFGGEVLFHDRKMLLAFL